MEAALPSADKDPPGLKKATSVGPQPLDIQRCLYVRLLGPKWGLGKQEGTPKYEFPGDWDRFRGNKVIETVLVFLSLTSTTISSSI